MTTCAKCGLVKDEWDLPREVPEQRCVGGNGWKFEALEQKA